MNDLLKPKISDAMVNFTDLSNLSLVFSVNNNFELNKFGNICYPLLMNSKKDVIQYQQYKQHLPLK